ncbi:MAG: GtrA family protein [Bauldia sp.]
MATTSGARHWGGFILSGGTAFVADSGITLMLAHFGLNRFVARLLGIAVAMVVAWLMHRRVTFAMDAGASWTEFLRFAAVAASANALNFVIYSLLLLAFPALATLVAIVIATAIATVASYLGFRLGVFREPPPVV